MDKDMLFAELVCLDAYKILKRCSKEALEALESGNSDEAAEKLRNGLALSGRLFSQSADNYFGI